LREQRDYCVRKLHGEQHVDAERGIYLLPAEFRKSALETNARIIDHNTNVVARNNIPQNADRIPISQVEDDALNWQRRGILKTSIDSDHLNTPSRKEMGE
jgi:hypothetical protein